MSLSQARSVKDLFSLQGKTALITGATGRLGFPMASALAEAGASVVTTSRDAEAARQAAASLPRVGDAEHQSMALDHMDEASIEIGFETAARLTGGIDILVNNGHEATPLDWRSITGEQFNRQLANATGYFLLARRLRDHLVARNVGGVVVMVGSMYGLVGSYPDVYQDGAASPAAYQTLKGGVIQLTRHLAVYWARDGVRVNCLSPGPFPGEAAPAGLVERLLSKSPMARVGCPEELKGAIVFLASDASSYVTGHNLVVDGGWTAW